eukprot:CFRG2802T1
MEAELQQCKATLAAEIEKSQKYQTEFGVQRAKFKELFLGVKSELEKQKEATLTAQKERDFLSSEVEGLKNMGNTPSMKTAQGGLLQQDAMNVKHVQMEEKYDKLKKECHRLKRQDEARRGDASSAELKIATLLQTIEIIKTERDEIKVARDVLEEKLINQNHHQRQTISHDDEKSDVTEKENVENQFSALSAELKKVTTELQITVEEKSATEQALLILQDSLTKASNDKMEGGLQSPDAQKQALERQLKDITITHVEQIKSIQDKLESARQNKDDVDLVCSQLKSTVQTLQSKLADTSSESKAIIDDLHDQLRIASSERDMQVEQRERVEQEKTILKAQLENFSSQIDAHEKHTEGLLRELDSVGGEKDTLKARLEDVKSMSKTNLDKSKSEIRDLTIQQKNASSESVYMKEELERVGREKNLLKTQLENAKAELDTLEIQLQDITFNSQVKIDGLECELRDLISQQDSELEQRAQRMVELERMGHEKETAEQSLRSVEGLLAESNSKIEGLSTRLASTTSEENEHIKELKAELERVVGEKENIEESSTLQVSRLHEQHEKQMHELITEVEQLKIKSSDLMDELRRAVEEKAIISETVRELEGVTDEHIISMGTLEGRMRSICAEKDQSIKHLEGLIRDAQVEMDATARDLAEKLEKIIGEKQTLQSSLRQSADFKLLSEHEIEKMKRQMDECDSQVQHGREELYGTLQEKEAMEISLKALQEIQTESISQIESLTRERCDLIAELSNVTQELESFKDELKCAQNDLLASTTDLKNATDKNEFVEARLNDVTVERDTYRERLGEEMLLNSEMQETLATQKRVDDESKSKIDELVRQLGSVRIDASDRSEELERELTCLREEKENIQSDLRILQAGHDQSEAQALTSETDGQVEGMHTRLAESKILTNNMTGNLEMTLAENPELETAICALESILDNVTTQVMELEKQVSDSVPITSVPPQQLDKDLGYAIQQGEINHLPLLNSTSQEKMEHLRVKLTNIATKTSTLEVLFPKVRAERDYLNQALRRQIDILTNTSSEVGYLHAATDVCITTPNMHERIDETIVVRNNNQEQIVNVNVTASSVGERTGGSMDTSISLVGTLHRIVGDLKVSRDKFEAELRTIEGELDSLRDEKDVLESQLKVAKTTQAELLQLGEELENEIERVSTGADDAGASDNVANTLIYTEVLSEIEQTVCEWSKEVKERFAVSDIVNGSSSGPLGNGDSSTRYVPDKRNINVCTNVNGVTDDESATQKIGHVLEGVTMSLELYIDRMQHLKDKANSVARDKEAMELTYKAEKESLAEELPKLKQRVEGLLCEEKLLREEISVYKNERCKYADENEKLSCELESLAMSIGDANDAHRVLVTSYDDLMIQFEQVKEHNNAAASESAHTKEELKNILKMKEHLVLEMSVKERENEGLAAKLRCEEDNIRLAEDAQLEWKTKFEGAVVEMDTLRTELQKRSDTITKLTGDLKTMETNSKKGPDISGDMRRQIADTRARLVDSEAKVEELRGMLKDASSRAELYDECKMELDELKVVYQEIVCVNEEILKSQSQAMNYTTAKHSELVTKIKEESESKLRSVVQEWESTVKEEGMRMNNEIKKQKHDWEKEREVLETRNLNLLRQVKALEKELLECQKLLETSTKLAKETNALRIALENEKRGRQEELHSIRSDMEDSEQRYADECESLRTQRDAVKAQLSTVRAKARGVIANMTEQINLEKKVAIDLEEQMKDMERRLKMEETVKTEYVLHSQSLEKKLSRVRERFETGLTWEVDDTVSSCRGCHEQFTPLKRKHHCRACGRIYCNPCSSVKTDPETGVQVRMCEKCHRHRSRMVKRFVTRVGDDTYKAREQIRSSTSKD